MDENNIKVILSFKDCADYEIVFVNILRKYLNIPYNYALLPFMVDVVVTTRYKVQ